MLKHKPEKMSEYDINGDGKINAEEWDKARDDVERMVYAESLADGSHESEIVVIEKPRFGLLPFIIADTEKKLIRRLILRTCLFLFRGLVTMSWGINFLIHIFK